MNPVLQLNDDFKYALDQLEGTSSNMFITGKAGTGKSTLLQLFRRTTRKNVVVVVQGVIVVRVGIIDFSYYDRKRRRGKNFSKRTFSRRRHL
jgi:nucleoside-triphosphatase THEP1